MLLVNARELTGAMPAMFHSRDRKALSTSGRDMADRNSSSPDYKYAKLTGKQVI
ncbi:MAG: hypothetical protein ACYS67_10395 [Planctomycetota bacterium]|jgi:hypothetical protein